MTVAAIALAIVVVYAKSLRWSVLVRAAIAAFEPHVVPLDRFSGLALVPVVLVGQLVNTGIPFRLGELVRIEALAARGVSRLAAASTVVVEKLCDGVALVVFAAVLSLVVPLPPWLNQNAFVLSTAGAILLVAGALTIRPILRMLARRADRVSRVVGAVTTSLLALRSPRVAILVFALTLASWIVGLVVNYFALRACGISPTTGLLLLVTVGGYSAGLLPGRPGRLGIFQYICVLAAEAFGVDPTVALTFAAVEYVAVVVVPSGLGGLSILGGIVNRGHSQSIGGSNP